MVTQEEILHRLLENDVRLQKRTTELTLSMEKLTKEVSHLVDIFTGAARKIEAEGLSRPMAMAPMKPGSAPAPLLNKLDSLLEQNKNLAKGLILLEEYVKSKKAE